jgi:beta-lactam-binding protein with PASTA domain
MEEVVYAPATRRAVLMPNLRGRSVRDAVNICAALGLQLEAQGDGGRALRQRPEAGAEVHAGQVVEVDFGRKD